jgi:hypothetical protein
VSFDACREADSSRLRTLPFLPVSKRPKTITSTKGTAIAVDQAKVEGKERVLKRGQVITAADGADLRRSTSGSSARSTPSRSSSRPRRGRTPGG